MIEIERKTATTATQTKAATFKQTHTHSAQSRLMLTAKSKTVDANYVLFTFRLEWHIIFLLFLAPVRRE